LCSPNSKSGKPYPVQPAALPAQWNASVVNLP
jgi:hypothetical protein